MRTAITISLAILTVVAFGAPALAQAGGDANTGAFAIGRGGAAAETAVDIQHRLRKLAATTGTNRLVDLQALLDPKSEPARKKAVTEGQELLAAGKQAYEELELEDAQAKFKKALKKFEYGFGYMDKTAHLVETLMFMGASWVLVGEPDKAKNLFLRASDLPGRKTLNTEMFPPNIQEIYDRFKAEADAGPRAKASLITMPQGASIYIDDVYRGGSPLQVDDLRPGVHLVRALKDGFRPWGGKITVNARRMKRSKLTLKPTARRKKFSVRFRKMTSEIVKGEPGPGATEMASFLGARRLVAVVLEGEPAAMTMRGTICVIDEELRHVEVKEVLDTTSPGYEDRLKEFLIKLLQTTPRDEFAEEEGAAGTTVAKADEEGKEKEDVQMGLDLADGEGKEADPGETEVAQADTGDVQDEQKRDDEADAEKIIKDTADLEPDDDSGAVFSWGYLQGKWWFWTAVGVVVVGAGVGTYFGATAGGDGSRGGELVLGLH